MMLAAAGAVALSWPRRMLAFFPPCEWAEVDLIRMFAECLTSSSVRQFSRAVNTDLPSSLGVGVFLP